MSSSTSKKPSWIQKHLPKLPKIKLKRSRRKQQLEDASNIQIHSPSRARLDEAHASRQNSRPVSFTSAIPSENSQFDLGQPSNQIPAGPWQLSLPNSKWETRHPSNEGRVPSESISHTPPQASNPRIDDTHTVTQIQVEETSTADRQPTREDHQTPDPVKQESAGAPQYIADGLVTALRVLDRVAGVFPPLKAAVGGVLACVDVWETFKGNDAEYARLTANLTTISADLQPYLAQPGLFTDESASTTRIVKSIQEQVDYIQRQQARNTAARMVRTQHDKDDVGDRFRQIVNLFQRLQTNISLQTLESTRKIRQSQLLERLSPIFDALYNSRYSTTVKRRGCTAETRRKIIDALLEWARDPNGAKVYWMNGMAGTGKTTILYTFCQRLAEERQLGANFFCSRISIQCRDVNNIVPTIAYLLAQYSPAFRSELCKVLEKEPEASKLDVASQLQALIQAPLASVKHALPEGVVVVIDALDECEDGSAMGLMLRSLLQVAETFPVKFFITSRPEPTIQDKMRLSEYSRFILHLHDIEQSIVNADIKLYLDEALSGMDPLPPSSQIQQLADKADKLFIFAATAARYIFPDDHRVDSTERLRKVLETTSASTGSSQHKELDLLYMGIILSACARLDDDEVSHVHITFKTVVCAKEPMTVEMLASILGITDRQVRVALQRLGSVLHVQEGAQGLVAPFHASFPDFLFNQHRSGDFYCDRKAHSAVIAKGCFDVMKSQLHFNMCNLETSSEFDENIPDLPERIKKSISAALSYASRFWGDHLVDSEFTDVVHLPLVDFLSNQLLFWMEALNLEGRISIGVVTLQRVQRRVEGIVEYETTRKQAADAEAFVSRFAGGACKRSTPHIYISLLAFYGRDSTVYRDYWGRMQGLITVKGRILETWRSSEVGVWKVEYDVYLMVFSPDGGRVACGLWNGDIHLLDAHTGRAVKSLSGHKDRVNSVAFTPDGRLIASASDDRTVRIWESSSGFMTSLLEHESSVASVAFSPGGAKVVAGMRNGTLQLWDVKSGEAVNAPLTGHSDRVFCVAFSTDGMQIISGSDDETVRIWDASGSGPTGPKVLQHTRMHAVTFFQNRITSISECTVQTWDANSGQLVSQVDVKRGREIRTAAFSHQNTRYVTIDENGDITVRETANSSQIAGPFRSKSFFSKVAISPDGRRVLASSYRNDIIQVWDTHSDQPLPSSSSLSIHSVAFFPDGHRIVHGGKDGLIRVWDILSGEMSPFQFKGHQEDVNCVAVSSDGKLIASASASRHTVQLWNAETGLATGAPFTGHTGTVWSVDFSPDGQTIISVSSDKLARIWDVQTGREVARLGEHTEYIRSVAYSPDGQRIATGSGDCTIRIWDAHSHQTVVGPLQGHTNTIFSLAFSPDGARIVSGSSDYTIRVWDSLSGDTVAGPFEGHTNGVIAVVFSPDGRVIASGSHDQTIRLWDSSSGAALATFGGHTDLIYSIALSTNGHWLVSGSRDGTCRVWDLPKLPSTSSLPSSTDTPSSNFPDGAEIDIDDDDNDGWVYADGKPFFWCPPTFHNYLPYPGEPNPTVLSDYGAVSIDYHNLVIGTRWMECNASL